MTSGGRVLLLEDDVQIRRFVSMVLSQLDVALVECAGVQQAVQALEQAPVDVVLCDLMLAGESGFDLIEQIVSHDAWRSARVIVFSAAVDGDDRARMEALGVWGHLSKPTPVAALMRCVSDALAARPAPRAVGASAGRQEDAAAAPRLPTPADEAVAIARFFEGNAELFRAYRDSSRTQFRHDLGQGDQACAEGDLAAMRRLAHSLKSVLGLLGGDALAGRFAALERLARDGQASDVRTQWADLRAFLQLLAQP